MDRDRLKRTQRPTTLINESQIRRVDERQNGFERADQGDFGAFVQHESSRFVMKHPLSGVMRQMTKALGDEDVVDGAILPKAAPLTEDPQTNSQHIKETAYFLRADMVGICELPTYAIYSQRAPDGEQVILNHKYAIAVLVDQDYRTAKASTGSDWINNAMSFRAYSASAYIAVMLAAYIRELGYPARAHHAMNYQVIVPPILVWAGLGEMSRLGDSVVNPFLGARFKAAIVTTNMPLMPDKPIDFGLQSFCSACKKCARECPVGAISDGDKIIYNGYEKWELDVKRCTSMRIGNQRGAGCGTCIKVCPWNKPDTWFHRSVNWTLRHFPFTHPLAARADDWLGYSKPYPQGKWWLDLENEEGELSVPKPRRYGR